MSSITNTERKECEGGGEEAGAGLVYWSCRVSLHGTTALSRWHVARQGWTHQRSAGSDRQCGGPITPLYVAQQRLPIAPVAVTQPNELCSENKTRNGLNFKYY